MPDFNTLFVICPDEPNKRVVLRSLVNDVYELTEFHRLGWISITKNIFLPVSAEPKQYGEPRDTVVQDQSGHLGPQNDGSQVANLEYVVCNGGSCVKLPRHLVRKRRWDTPFSAVCVDDRALPEELSWYQSINPVQQLVQALIERYCQLLWP